jgi:hypothetical protein
MRRVAFAAVCAAALTIAGTAEAKVNRSTLPPPKPTTNTLTVTSACDVAVFAGATACSGYFTGNLINNSPADIINAQQGVADVPGNLTWDGNWANVSPTIMESLLNGNVLDFGQTLFGQTIIGAHFGNIDGPAGNVTGFWLFDFGTTGASSVVLNNPNGFSNAAIFTTGTAPAVPEPATWAMMLFGFGIAGYAMRRRRTTALAQIA